MGVGKGGSGGWTAPLFGAKFYTFPKSVREEISAKRTFFKSSI